MARIYSISDGRAWMAAAALLLGAGLSRADSQLLYLELQGVGGYSSELRKPVYYSMNPEAEMQKPSVGFDYLARLASERGDWGSVGLQGRVALAVDDEGRMQGEPQIYNAWFRLKTPLTDVWVGHNRPALGLGSYFDSHALLLRTLPIQGFGYDRDWGVGTYRDFAHGNLQLSATTGSGMPIYLRDNYMLAARAALGVLNDDNYTVGVSIGQGRTLDTMGYTLRQPDPLGMRLVGADCAWMWNRLENRFDLFAGEWLGESTTAVMYRLGVLLDAEGRFKLEGQPTYATVAGENSWLWSACFSWLVTADLTFRIMYQYDDAEADHRVIGQLYYYKRL
ncbi:MAG: hypothetical protein NTY53_23875 [Kiritimatiellaeota bacterium]|nr:hypothetical protein [Kiritimatiellota bacterium]